MKNLKKISIEESKNINGGGAISTAIKIFFKILLTPTKVY